MSCFRPSPGWLFGAFKVNPCDAEAASCSTCPYQSRVDAAEEASQASSEEAEALSFGEQLVAHQERRFYRGCSKVLETYMRFRGRRYDRQRQAQSMAP